MDTSKAHVVPPRSTGEISVHFLTLESQRNRVPLDKWCREDGPSRVGLALGSVLSLEKAKSLSCPPWEAESPTLEIPVRCSVPHTVRKQKIFFIVLR